MSSNDRKRAKITARVQKKAVQLVKPRVDERTWARLRDPLQRRPPTPFGGPPSPSLNELAKLYRTDKWGLHWYTEHYERHLKHLRDDEFTLLEIGIGGYKHDGRGGESLRMWQAFFPRAQIRGLDIEDKSFVVGDRIRTYQGSQVDPAVLAQIFGDAGEIKVVIDDGSHRPEHIRESFARIFPLLAADGIYAIEDTQTSYWPVWGGSELLRDPTTTMAMVKDLLDGLHYEEFTDDAYEPTYADRNVRSVHAYHNLVIIEKGSNVEGTNRGRAKRTLEQDDPAFVVPPPVNEQRRPFSVPMHDRELPAD